MNTENTIDTTSTETLIAVLAAQGEALAESRRQLAELAAEQRVAEEKAKLAEKWAPILETIRSALPPWMHPCVKQPHGEPRRWVSIYDCYVLTPVVLALPDLAPIDIYLDTSNKLRYEAANPMIVSNDEYGCDVYWHTQTRHGYWDIERLTDALPIAIHEAQMQWKLRKEKEAEAAQRNEFQEARADEPPPGSPLGPKPRPADALASMDTSLNGICDLLQATVDNLSFIHDSQARYERAVLEVLESLKAES